MKPFSKLLRFSLSAFVVLCTLVLSIPALAVTLVHYNYTGHGDDHARFVAARAEAFMRDHPDIQIEIISNAGSDYWEKLLTMEAGGVPPDVLELYPAMAPPFIEGGVVRDLGPFVERDPEISLDAYVPVTVEGFTWHETLWGLPSSTFQILTFYNADMFDRFGHATPAELGSDWTWERLIEVGKDFTLDPDGDGIPSQWGVRAYGDLFRWWIFVHQAGGRLFDRFTDPTTATFTTEEARLGLQFFVDLFHTHGIATTDINAFYEGKVGIDIVDGPSLFAILPNNVGDTFRWDIAELPKGPDNNGTMVFLNGFQIGAGSRHTEEAWLWLKYLVGEESMREYIQTTGRTPALKSLLPEYVRYLPQPPANLVAAGDAILNPATTTPYFTVAATEIRGMANPLTQQAMAGAVSVTEVLEQIHQFANQRLTEARTR